MHSSGESLVIRCTASHEGEQISVFRRTDAAGVRICVDCVVTSPPYWGLRDYQVQGQYGSESTVNSYIDNLVTVFDNIVRLLKPSGCLLLNLGDTFGGSWGNYSTSQTNAFRPPQTRYRAKDLVGVPWRVVFALHDRGWLLQKAIIWHKPNARPESVQDRLAQCYDMLFLLTRQHVSRQQQLSKVNEFRDIWSIPKDHNSTGHRAAGTLDVARRCVRLTCTSGAVVLDPFSGSGTTGVAARENDCRFIGIDLDPHCHDIAWARLREGQP